MLYWVREIVGWLLVGVSFWLLWRGLSYIDQRQVVEGGLTFAAAVAILRTGVLLVRVSTAARIALDTRQEVGLNE